MPILNEAGAASYPAGLTADRLAGEQIAMSNLLTGENFGHSGVGRNPGPGNR